MGKAKIKQGGFVMLHHNKKEVYKVLGVFAAGASLIDAENRHVGTYPFDELKPVRAEKVRTVRKYEAKGF